MVKCIVLWVCGRHDLWLNDYVWCVVGVAGMVYGYINYTAVVGVWQA